ncbi:unnamed protein product [Cyclocybe aegerita]|uniref:Pre-mRNA-splicing factor 38 n=1 Tax=Cyclocybe aegerita TaxID=1973307 RepID=A0A8S0X5Q1_CYCAE|nr:unnamed protein product [Cyclocybe aegerita]
MANTTIAGAQAIHGQNPQSLVETVIRNRIYESTYWKEHCFALTGSVIHNFMPFLRTYRSFAAESLIDKATEVRFIGGVYGNQRPTEYLCLLLKLLQIQPEKEILVEYLRAEEFKYLRALAALYIRMTFRPVDIYELLEPLLKDYRKLRQRNMTGYSLVFMDKFVYSLLTEERLEQIKKPKSQQESAPNPDLKHGSFRKSWTKSEPDTIRRGVKICFSQPFTISFPLFFAWQAPEAHRRRYVAMSYDRRLPNSFASSFHRSSTKGTSFKDSSVACDI